MTQGTSSFDDDSAGRNTVTPKRLLGLTSREYEHPFDREALGALQKIKGIDFVLRHFNEQWFDRIARIDYAGSYLKVTARSAPQTHEALQETCRTLCAAAPDFYLKSGDEVNAFAAGVAEPMIVMNAGCVDRLSPGELVFVLGHEMGHILSGHILYSQVASILAIVGDRIGQATLGLGAMLTDAIVIGLHYWYRMSELTCDRAGLLSCQDLTTAIIALMRMAGIPAKHITPQAVEEFLRQAREFNAEDVKALDKLAKLYCVRYRQHPWTVLRASELLKWVESGQYDNVLQRRTRPPSESAKGTKVKVKVTPEKPSSRTTGRGAGIFSKIKGSIPGLGN